MSENKFIKHLKGVATEGSVLEIKNQATPASFANMPSGDSNPNTVFSDHRGNATAVLNGTDNWKLNDSALTLTTTVYGDGQDLTGTFTASGAGLWVNATHSFSSAKIFNGNTKWVLKLCGSNLLAESETIGFTLLVKLNNDAIITKDFTVSEQAGNFCKEFVIDFAEGEPDVVHMESGDTLTVQLLCADSTASATIYNGMTVLTALQRRVAGDTVSSDTYTFDEVATELDNKVSKSGDTMSGPLTFTNTAGAGGIFGYTNGVVFFYMNGDTRTQLAALNTQGFAPYTDNTMMFGGTNLRWKEAYITTIYTSALSNGYYNLAVPSTTGNDTLALKSEVDGKVNIDGSSIMTAPLKFMAGSMRGAVGPYLNGVGFWKLDSQANLTLIATISDSQFIPNTTNAINLGGSTKKWKDLYLAGKAYVATINNGGDLAVPAVSGTLATKADVDLAANSGRMITDQGVWYAKMDALGTIPASAEVEGRNYADFTQVDGNNNPIIVIYTYTSGAWVQTETITPPSAYDGYVPITSKIWDIPEQTGQQGGRILWNHTSKDFTPYPLIISFDGANITNGAFQGSADLSGTSTVTMPVSPSSTQIVNKDYVDTAIANIPSGAFDLFDIKWRDSTTSNTSWALSDGNWKTNATAYQHLADEYNDVDTLHLYEWHNSDSTKLIYLKIAVSTDAHSNEPVYNAEGVQIGVLFGYTATQVIYDGVYYDCDDSVGQDVKEAYADTIGGTTITYYLAADGHKIVLVDNKTDVDTVYANNSVAWYYILDTANQRFMLPRVDSLTQDLMTIAPIITGVDNTESLKWADKNGTGIGGNRALGVYGGTTKDTGVATNSSYNNTPTLTLNLKPTNLYAGLNSATGLFAGKMYLYFYVGA